MCVHVSVCDTHVPKGQERPLDSLGLQSQAVVSGLTWMVGTKFWSLKRAGKALNHRAISSFDNLGIWFHVLKINC